MRQALQLSQHDGLRELLGDRLEPGDPDLVSDEALDAWMLREAVTFPHISGTCKMGPSSDPMAVVSQSGRVYGLEGLRVADASIMPDLVSAPINPAVLMIGEKNHRFGAFGSLKLLHRIIWSELCFCPQMSMAPRQ